MTNAKPGLPPLPQTMKKEEVDFANLYWKCIMKVILSLETSGSGGNLTVSGVHQKFQRYYSFFGQIFYITNGISSKTGQIYALLGLFSWCILCLYSNRVRISNISTSVCADIYCFLIRWVWLPDGIFRAMRHGVMATKRWFMWVGQPAFQDSFSCEDPRLLWQ